MFQQKYEDSSGVFTMVSFWHKKWEKCFLLENQLKWKPVEDQGWVEQKIGRSFDFTKFDDLSHPLLKTTLWVDSNSFFIAKRMWLTKEIRIELELDVYDLKHLTITVSTLLQKLAWSVFDPTTLNNMYDLKGIANLKNSISYLNYKVI